MKIRHLKKSEATNLPSYSEFIEQKISKFDLTTNHNNNIWLNNTRIRFNKNFNCANSPTTSSTTTSSFGSSLSANDNCCVNCLNCQNHHNSKQVSNVDSSKGKCLFLV